MGDKGKSKSCLYLIHRKLSLPISYCLYRRTKITPNQVTFASIFLVIIGSLLLIPDILALNLLGFLLVYVSFIGDKIDGELARARKVTGGIGAKLDNVYHILFWLFFIFSVALNDFLRNRNSRVFAFAAAIVLVNLVFRLRKDMSVGKETKPWGIKGHAYFLLFHQINVFFYFLLVWLVRMLSPFDPTATLLLVYAFLFTGVFAFKIMMEIMMGPGGGSHG